MKRFLIIMLMFASGFSYSQGNVHVGEILCTDNSFVSADDFASSGKTALGIVFFVDNTHQHGWAVALTDAGSETSWGDVGSLCYLNSYNNNPQQVNSDTIGYARCDSIVRTAQGIPRDLSTYATAVNLAMQAGSGWFLPSIGQLVILYANIPEINVALDAIQGSSKMNGRQYWSCTEENYGVISAWVLNYDGAVIATPKGTSASVRAIRNF